MSSLGQSKIYISIQKGKGQLNHLKKKQNSLENPKVGNNAPI